MSKITPDEVRRLARLANIGLTEAELGQFSSELDQIMQFVEQLNSADTQNVEPTDQVTGLVDVWREDEIKPGLTHEEIKLNAPAWRDGQFQVPRVLE